MTAALTLERLMLNPGYDQFVEHARRVLPVHLVDQADAATTEAHAILSAAAVNLCEQDARPATAGDLPGWLRLGLLDAMLTFSTGRATTCRHNPDATRPQPVLAAAWKPGTVVCTACPHLLSLRHNADADATCDGCGHRCAGVEEGDGIYPGMVQFGPLIYQYGTCTGCRPTDRQENR